MWKFRELLGILTKKDVIQVKTKREGVYDMSEGCNDVWKRELSHECRADRYENVAMNVPHVSERWGIRWRVEGENGD